LNVPTASATNRGALSAADWTTFNNKQPAGTYVTNLTGPITSVGNATSIASQTGTGTTFAMSASPTFTGTVGAADLTTTGNTILGNASTDTMNVGNGDLIKDASGNVGIGTASPGAKLDINVGSAGRLRITETTGATLFDNVNTAASAFVTEMHRASSYAWGIGSALPATSMTLDASGNLLVGTTTDAGRVTIYGADSGAVNYALRVRSSSGTDGLIVRNDPYVGVPNNYNITTGSAANMYFGADGFIYRSTSSARYKTDIRNYDKGLDSVLSLRPVYYKSNNPDIDGNIPTTQFAGLIAEELDEVGLTEFVVYNNENQPEAIHYGNMISLLTKAIQEQQAIITSLTARLDALEG
jgi:hypothetical protein